MATRLNPYLSFFGNTREAMEHYREVFGGELTLSTFGEYGAEGTPDENKIMHAQLETPAGYTLMASDPAPGTPSPTADHSGEGSGQRLAISLSGDDAAELRGYWTRLAEGGTVTLPLEMQMWGDEFGMCVDRFGISWMVNIAGESPER